MQRVISPVKFLFHLFEENQPITKHQFHTFPRVKCEGILMKDKVYEEIEDARHKAARYVIQRSQMVPVPIIS